MKRNEGLPGTRLAPRCFSFDATLMPAQLAARLAAQMATYAFTFPFAKYRERGNSSEEVNQYEIRRKSCSEVHAPLALVKT